MAFNMRQLKYVNAVQSACANFLAAAAELQALAQEYSEAFGATGNLNLLQDADLEAVGLTGYNLGCITSLSTQLENFLNNQAVTAQANGTFLRNLTGQF